MNPADQGNAAILCACKRGRIEVVRLLMNDPRMDLEEFHNIAVNRAEEYRHIQIVKLLRANPRLRFQ